MLTMTRACYRRALDSRQEFFRRLVLPLLPTNKLGLGRYQLSTECFREDRLRDLPNVRPRRQQARAALPTRTRRKRVDGIWRGSQERPDVLPKRVHNDTMYPSKAHICHKGSFVVLFSQEELRLTRTPCNLLKRWLLTCGKDGAGDGTRTRDVQLGKLAFYH